MEVIKTVGIVIWMVVWVIVTAVGAHTVAKRIVKITGLDAVISNGKDPEKEKTTIETLQVAIDETCNTYDMLSDLAEADPIRKLVGEGFSSLTEAMYLMKKEK